MAHVLEETKQLLIVQMPLLMDLAHNPNHSRYVYLRPLLTFGSLIQLLLLMLLSSTETEGLFKFSTVRLQAAEKQA